MYVHVHVSTLYEHYLMTDFRIHYHTHVYMYMTIDITINTDNIAILKVL